MSTVHPCERCGSRLPAGTPPGFCSACLLEFGLHGYAEELADTAELPNEPGSRQLADYELLEEIARGGMGVVYRARQKSLSRIVAVKLLLVGQWAGPAEIARFRAEARAAARLDHPHIVPIHEVGEHEGHYFFSMRLVEGRNLAQALRTERQHGLAPSRRRHWVGLLVKIARAVHHAHQHGVLHRDLKPTNILIDTHGEPHLTDFGLAKIIEDAAHSAPSAATLGTPSYMAPEQAAGLGMPVTVAADVYGLGAVLYEILSGRPPFTDGSPLEILRRVTDEEPARPSLVAVTPEEPDRDIETICLKCLRKNFRQRYPTAEALADELDRWLTGRPILARPAGPLERMGMWTRRNRLATTVGVLLLVMALGAGAAAVRLRGQRDQINRHLGDSLLARAQAQRRGVEAERRGQNLQIISEAKMLGPQLPMRNEAIANLALPALGPVQSWLPSPRQRQVHRRMLAANGHRFAVFGEKKNIKVYQRETGDVLVELATPPEHVYTGRMSPDGRWLVGFDRMGAAHFWSINEPADGLLPPVRSIPGRFNYCADFAPDGQRVALVSQDNSVRWYDLNDGTERVRVTLASTPQWMEHSPDGKYLAYEAFMRFIVVDIATSAKIAEFTHTSTLTALAWHPNGRYLAVGYRNGDLLLFDTVRSRGRWLHSHMQYVSAITFEAGGQMVASSSWDSTQRFCDPVTGRTLFETKGGSQIESTSDGRWFVFLDDDGGIRARENLPSSVFRTVALAELDEHSSGVDFSPDGRWLVSGSKMGLRIWDMSRGMEVAFVRSPSALRPRFHPGGRHVVSMGKGALLRWPFVAHADGVRLGTPEPIIDRKDLEPAGLDISPDGSWMTVGAGMGLLVGRWESFAEHIQLNPRQYGTRHDQTVLSPDATWLAGAEFAGEGVSVWNARNGTKLHHLIERENAGLAVSPDGRMLATATPAELVVWDTATWKPRHRMEIGLSGTIQLPVAFSPDGRLLAVASNRQDIVLYDARTFAPQATLAAPVPLNIVTLRFSPDSRYLAGQTLGPVIQLWDLPALRLELGKLGLDW